MTTNFKNELAVADVSAMMLRRQHGLLPLTFAGLKVCEGDKLTLANGELYGDGWHIPIDATGREYLMLYSVRRDIVGTSTVFTVSDIMESHLIALQIISEGP